MKEEKKPEVVLGAWRVHTSNLLKEVLSNNTTGVLSIPMQIFGNLLFAVGERAAKLNDPELNALMVRLTIYSFADPESEDYNPELINAMLKAREEK